MGSNKVAEWRRKRRNFFNGLWIHFVFVVLEEEEDGGGGWMEESNALVGIYLYIN